MCVHCLIKTSLTDLFSASHRQNSIVRLGYSVYETSARFTQNQKGEKSDCCRYGMGQELFSNEEARGGSAWGAGTLANGDGSRQPSKIELDFAEYQVCPLA